LTSIKPGTLCTATGYSGKAYTGTLVGITGGHATLKTERGLRGVLVGSLQAVGEEAVEFYGEMPSELPETLPFVEWGKAHGLVALQRSGSQAWYCCENGWSCCAVPAHALDWNRIPRPAKDAPPQGGLKDAATREGATTDAQAFVTRPECREMPTSEEPPGARRPTKDDPYRITTVLQCVHTFAPFTQVCAGCGASAKEDKVLPVPREERYRVEYWMAGEAHRHAALVKELDRPARPVVKRQKAWIPEYRDCDRWPMGEEDEP